MRVSWQTGMQRVALFGKPKAIRRERLRREAVKLTSFEFQFHAIRWIGIQRETRDEFGC